LLDGLNDAVFGLLLLTGLAGSIGHCLGMCGPLVLMVGLRIKDSDERALPRHLVYHGSRVGVYALLGGAAGLIGSFVAPAKPLSIFGGTISIVFGLAVMGLGMVYLGWIPAARASGLRSRLKTAMNWALKRRGLAGAAALGGLNGLLPCGLVYGSLLASASTGAPSAGALAMFLFGIGTIPALLVAGLSAGLVGARVRAAFGRIAGVMMLLVAFQLAVRGFAVLGLAPHLQFGSMMLW
jgi:uncharacterized protein